MRALLLTGFSFVLNFCFAQTYKTDSLKKDLDAYAKKDTVRVGKLLMYGESLSPVDPDKAIMYLQQGIELAKELKWYEGWAGGLLDLANAQQFLTKYDDAVVSGLEALKISENIHRNETMKSSAYVALGEAYRQMNNDSLARMYWKKVLDLADTSKNEGAIFYALIGLANVASSLNEFDSLIKIASNMAYVKKDEYASFRLLTRKAEEMFYRKDYAGAVDGFRKMLSEDIRENDYHAAAWAEGILCQLYTRMKKKDSAYYFGQLALQTAKKYNLSKEFNDANFALYDYYYTFGDYKNALQYRILYDSIFNETFSMQAAQKAERARVKLEQEKKDTIAKFEQDKKETETKRTRNLQYTIIGAVLLVALFFYWNSRQKQKAKIKIEKAYSELKAAQAQLIQAEKMASLGELTAGIAHEIQNPLNFVNNFSEVNKEMITELKEEINNGNYNEAKQIANDIEENSEKINHHGKRADAIVKGMLQHSKTSAGTKEPTDINKLADEYLRLAYHGLRAKDKSFNAKFETDFDNGIGKINVVPQEIGRVLLNLYNNAFYAVSERQKTEREKPSTEGKRFEPCVSVQTKKLNDKIEIIVIDNGNGISKNIVDKIFQPFFTTKPTGQGTGLGLSLAYDIIKAHGGDIKVETKEGEGSEFIISLPIA